MSEFGDHMYFETNNAVINMVELEEECVADNALSSSVLAEISLCGSTEDVVETEDVVVETQPKPKRVKKVFTDIDRPTEVKLFDCETKEPVNIYFQNKDSKKTIEEYNP